MHALYPLVFHPRFKERVWGGRALETLYHKPLPPGAPIGESWEISDRPDDESVIANGPFAGRTLRWLMDEHGAAVLGASAPAAANRFPLLCKILDARDKLSLQVHPPARSTGQLGDPKTEMWHIVRADPGAELYVGLRRGVTRQQFEDDLRNGTVADCFHRIQVRTGDTMFLPSGRVHAIGSGLVIFEIQQNSDTTFRVFDWNRVGLDGRPRDLHERESLASIDFDDAEPSLATGEPRTEGAFELRALVRDSLFDADHVEARDAGELRPGSGQARVLAAIDGGVAVHGGGVSQLLQPGDFALLPASVPDTAIEAAAGAKFLLVEAGAAAGRASTQPSKPARE